MNLIPIANLLQSDGLGISGTTLFVDMMPSETTQGILLRNILTGSKINYELPNFYQTQFQLIIRTPSGHYDQGEALINATVAALTISAKPIESTFYNYLRPHTDPVVFPISKGNLLEFSVMMDCCFVKG